MIKRLEREEFEKRLDTYVQLHGACKRMLECSDGEFSVWPWINYS